MIYYLISLLYIAQAQRFLQTTTDEQCYGVIFDAGSSGTRVYVYNWDCRTNQSLPLINLSEAAPDKKITPGLSTYYNNITGIQYYLQPLINFAYSNVPSDLWSYTPIMLGATAGLRMLDPTYQSEIIGEVQLIFSQTKFYYDSKWVRVITGQEEGAYLWMSIYYLLQGTASDLLSIDIGGASTQIAFPQPNTTQDVVVLNIPGLVSNYDLYTVSYLGYGNDAARAQVTSYSLQPESYIIQSPCYHNGYVGKWDKNASFTIMGTGDIQQCQEYIIKYLNVSQGTSINGHYQPTVTNQTIYAVSAAANIASFFGIVNYTLPEYYQYAYNYCSLTYQEVQEKYGQDPYAVTNYFLSVYIYELLGVGYGIPNTEVIHSPDEIDEITPTWTLAAMSYNLAQISCEGDSPVCTMYQSVLLVSSMIFLFIME